MQIKPIFHLENLELVRGLMLGEVDRDRSEGRIYTTERLSAIGKRDWPDLLSRAVVEHSDAWLAKELQSGVRFNNREQYVVKGIARNRAINIQHASELLATSEFNRFYIRGLCIYAINNNIRVLIVYRARQSQSPRSESESKIGSEIDPARILEDLRNNIGYETALQLPAVNSGLSAKLPNKEKRT